MADILIRGMEMPKDGRITIQIGADGAVYFVENCRIMAEKYEKNSHAVTLPEGHGKLGDLDALDKFLHERETEADAKELYFDKAWYRTFRQILRLMQTIVPAEGSEEMENNICFTCKHVSEYPECPATSDDIVFASNGDMIVSCKAHEEVEGGGK